MKPTPEGQIPNRQIPDQRPDAGAPDAAADGDVIAPPLDLKMEASLSGAYGRILRTAIVFSVAGTLLAALLANWRSGLGLAIGSALAMINFVWLHRGTERIIERILSSDQATPRRFRFAFPFPLRYGLILTVVYVILKSYPRLLIGFIVGLILPILASMGEGIYEALVTSRIDQASD
jgi:hypothetical protein